ncbi:MAG: hypothetical protein KC713_02450 [Candidatus Omnitrophica bacterium]|nr:hypothetical protein [Candidatus Omnitrophota bacterium]
MKKHILPLIAVVFLFAGCSLYHVNSEDISADYYPSKNSPEEILYIENVKEPHEVIAYVNVNAERRQKISEVIDKMKREAAILGGDAITAVKTDATGTWKSLPAQEVIGNAYVRANFKASVIKFK